MQWKPEDWVSGLACYKDIMQVSPYDLDKLIRYFGPNNSPLLKMANQWLVQSPQDKVIVYQFLGWYYYVNREYPKAIDWFLEELKSGPNPNAYWGLMAAQWESNKRAGACYMYGKWKELDPGAPEKLLKTRTPCPVFIPKRK